MCMVSRFIMGPCLVLDVCDVGCIHGGCGGGRKMASVGLGGCLGRRRRGSMVVAGFKLSTMAVASSMDSS
ncbi:hypothetical protein VNO77_42249 [Canavalia gladiata]|uniref:Uncharacterized protein n=1 Tax=Canavalia gladiata TaxID=3824 RepID=A0AAN9PQU7_CANGL